MFAPKRFSNSCQFRFHEVTKFTNSRWVIVWRGTRVTYSDSLGMGMGSPGGKVEEKKTVYPPQMASTCSGPSKIGETTSDKNISLYICSCKYCN